LPSGSTRRMLPYCVCWSKRSILQLKKALKYYTHIVMSKDQLLVDLVSSTVLFLQPCPISLYDSPECRPLRTAHKAPLSPVVQGRGRRRSNLFVLKDLSVKPGDDLLTMINQVIPFLPDGWACLSFLLQEINSRVEFSDALSNLLRSLWYAYLFRCKRSCMKKLFKATV